MAQYRDVEAFEERAPGYESGWLGRMHRDIADRTVALALAGERRAPTHVLDVGCGTGYLLRQLAARLPEAEHLDGIDAAGAMVAAAQRGASDGRIRPSIGVAEQLPFADGSFDLVVSTTSFDHWSDQQAGLSECARVLRAGGRFVLADLFSLWLWPTLMVGDRRGKARTKGRAARLLREAGFRDIRWHPLHTVVVNAVSAVR